MASIDSQRFARWREVRQRGRLRYVVTRGLLGFGLVFVAVVTLLRLFVGGEYGPQSLWTVVLAGPLAGVLWAAIVWSVAEDAYKRHLSGSGI